VTDKAFRKPNALKHGAFSAIGLMPWEDEGEFEELRRGLFEDFRPEGPLQEDCVNTILSCMWRKRRVRAKRQFDTAAELDRIHNRTLWEDPPPFFDEGLEACKHALINRRPGGGTRPREDYQQLLGFSSNLYGDSHRGIVELSISMLPSEFSKHLQKKLPKENFDSTYEWVFAIKSEVDNVLLPMVRGREPQGSDYFATASAFLTNDRILEDLAIEERLDAHIDRNMKRLFQLKLGRQLHASDQLKVVEKQKLNQIEHNSPTLEDTKAT
jgi:hypothetical protein